MKKITEKEMGLLLGKGLLLIVLAAVYSFGIACFIDPNDLAPGGVTGIAILANRLTQIPEP